MGFLKAVPAGKLKDDFNGNSLAVDRIRELVGQAAEAHPDVKFGVTGIPVLENDEMRRSQSDMTIASIISIVGVAAFLFIGFRGFRHPLLGVVMLFVGMAWTFGYTTLVIGHLNILSVSFAVILIGLGIDFAIHYLARYLELRHQGQNLRPALRDTSTGVGAGIITGALTTAFAFLCATFTEFLGVAELGIIAGGGIILCCIATFLVLPAMIALADQNVEPKKLPTPFGADWLRGINTRFPRLVLCLSLGLILGITSQAVNWTAEGGPTWQVAYDCNLLNLQAKGVESVEVQKRIFGEGNDSLLFAVSIAKSAEEARRLKQQFEALPSVQRVEELASRLPVASTESTAAYARSFRNQLAGLSAPSLRPPIVNPAAVGRAFEELLMSLRRTNMPSARDRKDHRPVSGPLRNDVLEIANRFPGGLSDEVQHGALDAASGHRGGVGFHAHHLRRFARRLDEPLRQRKRRMAGADLSQGANLGRGTTHPLRAGCPHGGP